MFESRHPRYLEPLEQLPMDSGATESGAKTCEASGARRWNALRQSGSRGAWRCAEAGGSAARSVTWRSWAPSVTENRDVAWRFSSALPTQSLVEYRG